MGTGCGNGEAPLHISPKTDLGGLSDRQTAMFTRPVWHRRVVTVVVFLALWWFAGAGDMQLLRVMAFALAFWVPFSLHHFWRLTDANERDKKP